MRIPLRALILFGLWVALSGHLDPFLLGVGLACALGVALLAERMNAVDPNPPAILPGWRLWAYLPWLTVKVVQSNWDVARRVLHPRLPIDPRVVRIPASQVTAMGRTVFANSITLTPGTVAIDVEGDCIRVHALNPEQVAELETGEMDRRVTRAEGYR